VADNKHLARLQKGVAVWNHWRRSDGQFPDLSDADLHNVDLCGAHLSGANLCGADLSGADLSDAHLNDANLNHANLGTTHLNGADLSGADLRDANLSGADLSGADLNNASLGGADLNDANLSGADLSKAELSFANLNGADLSEANLNGTVLYETVLANVDLTGVMALETCRHVGPSVIDFRTLRRSHPLPLVFLRGVGLPENVVDYLPSLLNQAIQYYSCFISYSSKDDDFAKRIYADLQNNGVRCWFAPHDSVTGHKTRDEIDAAIRLREKVLLLSEHSIVSDWVEDEVNTAYEEERKRKQTVLFPVRLDDTVLETNEAWAAKLRNRNIRDFRQWKDHDRYREVFERVLRDLAAGPKKTG
jgi:uncharacterized protein YjbI with pentapeptide repeats